MFFLIVICLGVLDPLVLVFLGFSLATVEYFPEDLLKAIFNIKFLARLDSQLESMYYIITFTLYLSFTHIYIDTFKY